MLLYNIQDSEFIMQESIIEIEPLEMIEVWKLYKRLVVI